MTKSTGVGRGVGGGRPRKHNPAPPAEAKKRAKDQALVTARRLSVLVTETGSLAPAASLIHEAYATLADVMANCPIGAPRVAAARAIIDLARAAEEEAEKAKAEASGQTGKKVAAKAVADQRMAEGGKFSAPPPPPGALQRMN